MFLDTPLATILTIVLICHQLFVLLWLWLTRREPRTATGVLAAFLLVNVVCETISVVQSLGLLLRYSGLLAIYQVGLYALPPLMYLYAFASAPSTAATLPRRAWRLAAGPLAALVCMLPFLALDPARRIVALEAGYLDIGLEHRWMAFSLQLAVLAFPLYAIAYWSACFLRLRRHLHVVEGFFSNIEDKTLSWLRWVLLVLCVAVAWNALGTLAEPLLGHRLVSDAIEVLLEAAWVYPLTLLALMQPPVFADTQQRVDALETGEVQAVPRKYARSALEATDLARIATKIERVLREEHLYREATLTLRDLSDRTGVPQNYLSQTLNTHLGRSFFDYVNGWRIEEACRRLSEGETSVLAISEEVGFHSRSTFNAAFKKATGLTPSAYRRNPPPAQRRNGSTAGAVVERTVSNLGESQ